MPGRGFIGTSGWTYGAWRDDFYGGRPAKDWLAFCGTRFTGIEINATHYRLQSLATFRRWRDQTPPGFRFALKAHRYLTHNRKLRDPLGPIGVERERAAGLGCKLAVVLWQLPRNFGRNLERLEAFARALRAWARKLRRWRRALRLLALLDARRNAARPGGCAAAWRTPAPGDWSDRR